MKSVSVAPSVVTIGAEVTNAEVLNYHKVEFDLNGGYVTGSSTEEDLNQRVEHGQNAKAPTCDHSGWYYFNGWNPKPNNILKDTKCVAKWRYDPPEPPKPTHTVTFLASGGRWTSGDPSMRQYTVTEGNDSPIPSAPDIPPEGKKFNGWYGNTHNVTEDRTIRASWVDDVPTYDVIWRTGANGSFPDGTDEKRYSVPEGGNSPTPPSVIADPDKGFRFIGWGGGDPNNVHANVYMYARYEPYTYKYIVAWDAGTGHFSDGSSRKTETVNRHDNAKGVGSPSNPPLIFKGWSGNSQDVTEDRAMDAIYQPPK